MTYDELSNSYRETPRAQLAVPTLILAPVEVSSLVRTVLEHAAQPGFLRRDQHALDGVPPGWILFEQVRLVRRPRGVPPELDQLRPSGSTELALVGGLRLPPGRAWLASRAPQLCASGEGDGALRLALLREKTDTGEFEQQAEWTDDGALVVDLTDLDLPFGRYEASVSNLGDDRLLHRHHFALVTPESATAVEEWLAHDLDRPFGSLSAQPAAEVALTLRGADLPAGIPHDSTRVRAERTPTIQSEIEPDEPRCLDRPTHHFVRAVARTRDGRVSHAWHCSRCGARRPDRPMDESRLEPSGRAGTPASREPPSEALDLDALLEAASALGSGRYETLLGLIDRVGGSDDQDGRRLIEVLSALGHIDMGRDLRSLRPARWSIAPPAIVLASPRVFLSGWRSWDLVRAMGRAAHAAGGRLKVVPQVGAPSMVTLEDLDRGGVESVARAGSDSAMRPIVVVEHPGPRLAQQLFTLDEIRQDLTLIEPRWGSGTQAMNPRSGRWGPCPARPDIGAFRLRTPAGWLYWHSNGEDARRLDHAMAGWLAMTQDSRVARWNADDEVLRTDRRHPLPGLLERAAVLCSGRPPLTEAGALAYEDIDEATGRALIARLAYRNPAARKR
jgi:hypothetical protein